MRNLQGVIFDMDGLIFDTEHLYYRATKEIADELAIDYDMEIYKQYIGVGDDEVWAAYHEMYDDLYGEEVIVEFIDRSFNRTIELFEAGAADLKPGLTEILDYLAEKQIPRIIASSNQRRIIDILLEKNGLQDAFEHIVSFEDVTRAKPDPQIFEKAHQFFDAPKENILILEDSKNGILAAHSAGIDVIMIPDLLEPTPDLVEKSLAVLDTLADVPGFLEK